jgi:hypothetical protein
MPQTLTACAPAIASVVTTAISASGGVPQEAANEYPFVVVSLFDGMLTSPGNDWTEDLVNIAIDVLVPRAWDIGVSMPLLLGYVDTLKVALWTQVATAPGLHFDNTIDTFANIAVAYLPFNPWSNVDMIGYRLVLEGVKLEGTLEE